MPRRRARSWPGGTGRYAAAHGCAGCGSRGGVTLYEPVQDSPAVLPQPLQAFLAE